MFFKAIEENKIIPLCEQNSLWFQGVRLKWGVPQGSVLGPMFFNCHMSPDVCVLCGSLKGLKGMFFLISLGMFWQNPVFASGELDDLHSYEWGDFQRQVSVLRRDYHTKEKKQRAGERATDPAKVGLWKVSKQLLQACTCLQNLHQNNHT